MFKKCIPKYCNKYLNAHVLSCYSFVFINYMLFLNINHFKLTCACENED